MVSCSFFSSLSRPPASPPSSSLQWKFNRRRRCHVSLHQSGGPYIAAGTEIQVLLAPFLNGPLGLCERGTNPQHQSPSPSPRVAKAAPASGLCPLLSRPARSHPARHAFRPHPCHGGPMHGEQARGKGDERIHTAPHRSTPTSHPRCPCSPHPRTTCQAQAPGSISYLDLITICVRDEYTRIAMVMWLLNFLCAHHYALRSLRA
jgi:hypothetical protein